MILFEMMVVMEFPIRCTPRNPAMLDKHGDAGTFYKRLGFAYTGEILGSRDHVMKISFRK